MKKAKRYSLIFDKYVPNRHGGVDCERCTVTAKNKTTAVKVMKNNLYNKGAYGARGAVRYQNGKVEYIQPRKCPDVHLEDVLQTSMRFQRLRGSSFGEFNKR